MAKVLPLELEVLPGSFGIYRFDPGERVPEAVLLSPFYNLCRTGEELSIVCGEDAALNSPRSEEGWSCIKVVGPLDFSLTGILAHLAGLLAAAGISLFAFSTFDTDYLLVKTDRLTPALKALKKGGCRFP
jgi:uncharacterized protein